jgi:hypothetical protein
MSVKERARDRSVETAPPHGRMRTPAPRSTAVAQRTMACAPRHVLVLRHCPVRASPVPWRPVSGLPVLVAASRLVLERGDDDARDHAGRRARCVPDRTGGQGDSWLPAGWRVRRPTESPGRGQSVCPVAAGRGRGSGEPSPFHELSEVSAYHRSAQPGRLSHISSAQLWLLSEQGQNLGGPSRQPAVRMPTSGR